MAGSSTDFARLVASFLTDWLPLQRGYSANTVGSYRDAIKLLCVYVTEERGMSLESFTIGLLDRELVVSFLEWLRSRGCKTSTANQRLAAVKSLAAYAQLESVEHMAQMQEVMAIRSAKSVPREVSFLTVEQVAALVNRPDAHTRMGLRHRVALSLLYDAGCRVQELCDMAVRDVATARGCPTARLVGKGRKARTVVISDATARLVRLYVDRQRGGLPGDAPLVTNRSGGRMTRDGMRYVVSKYASMCHADDPAFPGHVHCHMLRHSKAVHMLAAGVNIVYIRDFLGHEDVSTTMVYARADNRVKQDAICALAPKVTGEADMPDWRKDGDLIAFLNSLG